MNNTYGQANGPWGKGSIWGSGSLTNSFASRAATRDTSRSRDGTQQASKGSTEELEGKTGSGSLVDGTSVLHPWGYRPAQTNKPDAATHRSLSQARTTDHHAAQQRSVSNAGVSSFPGQNQNAVNLFSTRPPTISLNTNTSSQTRSSFSAANNGTLPGSNSEPPPAVYTKFNRAEAPFATKPDSAIGSWADAVPSPTDERRSQYSGHRSIPGSRDMSGPPSRHSDDHPSFSRPDYARSFPKSTPTSSRAPSLASTRNGYSNGLSHANSDQLSSAFGSMRLDNSRPSTSYRPSNSVNGYSRQNSMVSNTGQSFTNGTLVGNEQLDDTEEIDRSNVRFLGLDGYMSPPTSFADFSGSNFGHHFPQTPSTVDSRTFPYQTGDIAPRAFDLPGMSRVMPDWQSVANGSVRRSPSTIPDQQPYLDPRLHQFLAAQLRNPYTQMYNPYAMPNGASLGGVPPYMPVLQYPMQGVDPGAAGRDVQAGDGVQSALLYEFKSNTKTKRYELKDIYDHIAEFSGDQHGSRFIQTKLETANSDDKERVFRELQPNALQLMTDVFGNYVIQKFFEHGDQTHKKILASKMRGQVLNLSLQMYGCRVVQKALDHVLVDQQMMLISELEGHVLKCVKDQNGNHVVQKAIERCPASAIVFIVDAFRGQVQHLSIHPYGCRVVQRCLERPDTPSKALIMEELMDGVQGMVSDQYGNYVVQHVVMAHEGHPRMRVLQIVLRGLEGYSKHKFASNVVEKCLQYADDVWRRQVVYMLADNNQRRVEGEGVLVGLVKDSYGNYVIQKLLDTLCLEDFGLFVDILQPAVNQAKRAGCCGKHIQAVEKRMHRFSTASPWPAPGNAPTFRHPSYQLALPTPPFVSHYGSAAGTPPPLTADTQGLQSSAIPSINGDAVEGADRSRKGSDHSADGRY